MRTTLAIAAVLTLGAASIARADAIDPDAPPLDCGDGIDCPPGTTPAALSHSSCPSVCQPNAECATAADCTSTYGEGARCEPTRFCIETAYSGPGMSESAVDACDPSGPCGAPTDPAVAEGDAPRCSEVSRCIEDRARRAARTSPPNDAPARGGCAGCATATDANARHAALLSLLWLVALRRRRRHEAA